MDARLILRNQNAKSKLPLFERVLKVMGIPRERVYILLDDGEYPAYVNNVYRRAFYMNIRVGGIEERSPEHVLEIMYKDDCEHFIWISPSVINNSDFYATWVFAHELQHLVQDTNYPDLSKVANFLMRALPIIKQDSPLNQLDLPAELDAEIKAKEVTIKLFGEDGYRNFVISAVKAKGDVPAQYYRKLHAFEATWSGNLRSETLSLLCTNKQRFMEQQKKLGANFDIEKLCSLSVE